MNKAPEFKNTFRMINFLIWFAKLFTMKKRIKIVKEMDGKEWHAPQVKMGYFSSWQQLMVENDIDVVGENRIDFSKADIALAGSQYSLFERFDDAVKCISVFEQKVNLEKTLENQKPKYVYL